MYRLVSNCVIVWLMLLVGCDNKIENVYRASGKVEVGFRIERDVTLLFKDSERVYKDATDDLMAIQIYQRAEGDLLYHPYGYAMCEDYSNLSVVLSKGCEYRFSLLLLCDGKSVVAKNVKSGAFRQPFLLFGKNAMLNRDGEFEYSPSVYFSGLGSGKTALVEGESYTLYNRPPGDRYYGEVVDLKIMDSSPITIEMRRVAFGLRYDVRNFTEGRVRIAFDDSQDINLTPDSYKSKRDYITMSGGGLDTREWIKEGYAENVSFTVYYSKFGAQEEIIAKKEHKFVRNTEYTIVVDLVKNDNNSSIWIDIVDDEMNNGGEI